MNVSAESHHQERLPVSAGLLALSILHSNERRRLIDDWIQSGPRAGAASPTAVGTGSLIDFLAAALPDPSPALALCRIEQIALRAAHQAQAFRRPDPARLKPHSLVQQAAHAGLVLFPAGCELILARLLRLNRLPADPRDAVPLLVAPGAFPLYRLASAAEHNLWAGLNHPAFVTDLLQAGNRLGTIAALLSIGALEYTW